MTTAAQKANAYICSVIGIGAALLLDSLHHWSCPDWRRFLAFCALAMLAATLKIRLPGMPGTFSLGFIFVLMSMVEFNTSQAMIVGVLAAVVQSRWRAAPRPTVGQVLFSAGNYMLTIAICTVAVRLPLVNAVQKNVPAEIIVLSCVFFAVNTLLVSGVIATLEDKDTFAVWRLWFHWSFPYHLMGSAIAALAVSTGRAYGWGQPLIFMPFLLFLYAYYRIYVERCTRSVAATVTCTQPPR